ncbi:PcfJ domain-containing protein [Rhodobium gokarnense]|uniref:Uncharacterized protein n=1 Tax=Rhodobium gokarnense TaxID=364296 RepID=A0ABT3H7A7_9HYPH|nr:PcfJ domain-containing protein [Rhodobium gokarnense]MCW2306266.1 hypothetical protein [Rhodobium gokarnense]
MTCKTTFAGTGKLRPGLDAQLRRYHRDHRRRLRKLARGSVALRDLVHGFPAMAVALVTGYRTRADRDGCIAVLTAGGDLKRAAGVLGLPFWLRRLPPEAFVGPLDEGVDGKAASDEKFARRVVNLVPEDPNATAMWLAWVQAARRGAGDDFALWLASRRIYRAGEAGPPPLTVLAAYTWFSANRELTAASLIGTPWHARMALPRAVAEAKRWFHRAVFGFCRSAPGIDASWYRTQAVAGIRFVPLTSREALRREGDRMANCVAGYHEKVVEGGCLIYGLRRDDAPVATMELVPHPSVPGVGLIAQLLGPGNTPVDRDVVEAARTWRARQGPFPLGITRLAVSPERWERLFAPYREAMGADAAIAEAPTPAFLARISRELAALEAIATKAT